MAVIASDIDIRIVKFETFYNEKIQKMQVAIDKETVELKNGLESFMNRIWPKIQVIEGQDDRLKNIVEYTKGFEMRMKAETEENQK